MALNRVIAFATDATFTAKLAIVLSCLLLAACADSSVQRRHADLLSLDTHVDIPSAYMREPRFDVGTPTALRVDLGKMQRGGLNAAFFVIFVEQGPLTDAGYAAAVVAAERKYRGIELMLTRHPERIRLATTAQQVRDLHANGLLAAMIGIENGYSLGHDLKRLDAAYTRGARYLGLVHVGNNDLCTSSLPNADLGEAAIAATGATEFGRAAIERANRLGMMVDISHASDACVRDVLQLSRAPIIASHSAARALVDHPRNLSDEWLKAIASKGGVIQVVAYKEFLKVDPARKSAEKQLESEVAQSVSATAFDSEAHNQLPLYIAGMQRIQSRFPLATLSDYVEHIAYVARVAGIDHVGIASDFDGGGGVTGWMDASETGNVTQALRQRGFSEVDIAKIWGGNLLRVWDAVENVAEH